MKRCLCGLLQVFRIRPERLLNVSSLYKNTGTSLVKKTVQRSFLGTDAVLCRVERGSAAIFAEAKGRGLLKACAAIRRFCRSGAGTISFYASSANRCTRLLRVQRTDASAGQSRFRTVAIDGVRDGSERDTIFPFNTVAIPLTAGVRKPKAAVSSKVIICP